MLLCELVTKNPASKELILRPPILNVSFHPKGCQAVATYSGYGGHRLCVPVEGCTVFEWLLIDMELKTNSGAQLHSPAPGKLLCQRLASESCTEGLFAWGRRGDYEAHWVGKWFYKEKPSEQIIEIGPWTQETRTEVCFLVPTWKFWQKKGRKRRKKGRRSSGQT